MCLAVLHQLENLRHRVRLMLNEQLHNQHPVLAQQLRVKQHLKRPSILHHHHHHDQKLREEHQLQNHVSLNHFEISHWYDRHFSLSLNRTSNKSKETFITMGLGVNGCLNYIEYNLNHATELYLFKHFYIFVFSDNRFFSALFPLV